MSDFIAYLIVFALALIPIALFFLVLYHVVKKAIKDALRESGWLKP